MERHSSQSVLLAAAALFAFTAAFAQNVDPTLPEDAEDEQTMVPEDADDDGELVPEDADDTTTAAVTTTPAAAPLRQATAPPRLEGAPLNVLVIGGAQRAESTEALRGGCWVRLYEGPNFAGNSLTVLGPADVPQPEGPFGMEWEDDVGSLEVGPAATVSVFTDDDFEGTELQIPAGRRTSGLTGGLESLRIACAQAR